MAERVTYGDLDATLRSFGFSVTEAPGKHRLYRNADRDAAVMLAFRPFDDEAPFFSWGAVRGTLADWGFIDHGNFFDIVRKHGRVAS